MSIFISSQVAHEYYHNIWYSYCHGWRKSQFFVPTKVTYVQEVGVFWDYTAKTRLLKLQLQKHLQLLNHNFNDHNEISLRLRIRS